MTDIHDFDRGRLADYDEARIADLSADCPEIYANHLAVATWIDGWRERAHAAAHKPDEEFERGFEHALREIAAHLRQGDLLPEGIMLAEQFPDGY